MQENFSIITTSSVLQDKISHLYPSFLIGYLAIKQKFPFLPGWSCPIRHATGIPCPSCLITRSAMLSLSGDLSGALKLHILGPFATLILVYYAIKSAATKQIRIDKLDKFFVYSFSILALAYWLYRIYRQYALGFDAFPA